MSKSTAIKTIKHAARSGAHQLHRAGLGHAAHAIRVIGGATASIGSATPNWQGELGGLMRSAPLGGGGGRRKRKSKSGGTKRRRKGHRTPAQKRATEKMLRANRAARRANGGKRRKGGGRRRAKR